MRGAAYLASNGVFGFLVAVNAPTFDLGVACAIAAASTTFWLMA